MKIVDLDSLHDEMQCRAAAEWVGSSLVPIKTDTGNKMVPGEAIYFFSTKSVTPYVDAQSKKLLHPEIPQENYWSGASIGHLLARMIDGLNSERKKYGLRESSKFHPGAPSRVWVLTDREFGAIENMGAIPLPMKIIGGENGSI